jgi:hypothetical protein
MLTRFVCTEKWNRFEQQKIIFLFIATEKILITEDSSEEETKSSIYEKYIKTLTTKQKSFI